MTHEIELVASAPAASRSRVLRAAVAEAVRRGGTEADNTTALLVAFEKTPSLRVSPALFLGLTTISATAALRSIGGRKQPAKSL